MLMWISLVKVLKKFPIDKEDKLYLLLVQSLIMKIHKHFMVMYIYTYVQYVGT